MIMTGDNDHDNKYRASPPRLNQRGWRVTKVAIYHPPSSSLQARGCSQNLNLQSQQQRSMASYLDTEGETTFLLSDVVHA